MDSVNTQGECVLGTKSDYYPNSHNQKPVVVFNTGNTDKNDSFSNANHLDAVCSTRILSVQISHENNNDNLSSFRLFFNQVLRFFSIFIYRLTSQLASTTNSVPSCLVARTCTAYQQIKLSALNSISQFISIICSNNPPIKLNIIVDGIGSTK